MSILFAPPAWMADAACATGDPADFFSQATEDAKAICADCPVVAECLVFALEGGDDYGVFGGMSAPERRALADETAQPCERGCGRSFSGKGSMRSHLLWCGTGRRQNLNDGTTATAACGKCGGQFETRGMHRHEEFCGLPTSAGGHSRRHGPSCRCGSESCRAAAAAERRRQRDEARARLAYPWAIWDDVIYPGVPE